MKTIANNSLGSRELSADRIEKIEKFLSVHNKSHVIDKKGKSNEQFANRFLLQPLRNALKTVFLISLIPSWACLVSCSDGGKVNQDSVSANFTNDVPPRSKVSNIESKTILKTQSSIDANSLSRQKTSLSGASAFVLKAERNLQAIDREAAQAGQPIVIPPMMVTADITDVPLRRVLKKLTRVLNVKVKIADGVPDEKISVAFNSLPVEEGIKKILENNNYLLIRREKMAKAKDLVISEIQIFPKNAPGIAASKSASLEPLNTADDLTAESAKLTRLARESQNPKDRLVALTELVEGMDDFGDEAVTPAIVDAFKDNDPLVRDFALESIENLDFPPIEPMTTMALEDDNPDRRGDALDALMATHGFDIAKPVLEQALNDPAPGVQETAQSYLDEINSQQNLGAKN